MRLQRLLLLLTLPFVISLSACIALPVAQGGEELIRVERLAFIQIGKSTKEEIAIAMSDLQSEKDEVERKVRFTRTKYRDGDWWLYAHDRKEAQWFIIVGADAGTIGDVDYRFLLIKFDKKGIVTGYELSSSESWGCSRDGICIGGPHHNLLASEAEDRVVKQFDIPADQCGVYVYGKRVSEGPDTYVPAIWLDGDYVGYLLDKKQFLFWQLDEGAHQLTVHPLDDKNRQPIEFSCSAGGLYFFEVRRKRPFWGRPVSFWIEQRDAVKGRKSIDKRRLTLNATERSD